MAAGRVTGKIPGSGGGAELGGPEPARDAGQASKAGEGTRFAEKLAAPSAAAATPRTDEPLPRPGIVGDLAADLEAGRLSGKAAIAQVIDRVVEQQVGPNAPAAVRDKIRAALEEALADDPLLAQKLRAVDRR